MPATIATGVTEGSGNNRQSRQSLEVALAAPILTHMRLRWPLTGRSNEMRLIEAAISDREYTGS